MTKVPQNTHVSVRLTPDVIARLDVLTLRLTPYGSQPMRSTGLRACVMAGLEAIERDGAAQKGGAS